MSEIVINEVTFYPIRPTEKGLIGFANCTFDNKLSLNSISVYTSLTGDIRLLFPDKVLPNSKRISVYYPVNRQTYDVIKEAVEKKIEELAEKAKGEFANEQESRVT